MKWNKDFFKGKLSPYDRKCRWSHTNFLIQCEKLALGNKDILVIPAEAKFDDYGFVKSVEWCVIDERPKGSRNGYRILFNQDLSIEISLYGRYYSGKSKTISLNKFNYVKDTYQNILEAMILKNIILLGYGDEQS